MPHLVLISTPASTSTLYLTTSPTESTTVCNMADDFEMTDAPSGVSLSENAFGTANNDTGGDFQLSDWDLFELACSGKQLPDDVLDALDELAKRNLEVKLSRVGRHIEKPTIEKLYFRENEAMLVCVPLDIGLPFLLEYYNALARMGEYIPCISCRPYFC